jgi:hypothetical protein
MLRRRLVFRQVKYNTTRVQNHRLHHLSHLQLLLPARLHILRMLFSGRTLARNPHYQPFKRNRRVTALSTNPGFPQQRTVPTQHHIFRHWRGRKRDRLRTIPRRLLVRHIPCLLPDTPTANLNTLTDETNLPTSPVVLVRFISLL